MIINIICFIVAAFFIGIFVYILRDGEVQYDNKIYAEIASMFLSLIFIFLGLAGWLLK